MSGMPIAAAAISSSRIATHARPSRESRRRALLKIVSSTSTSAVQKNARSLFVPSVR